jgi:hypothetical protein
VKHFIPVTALLSLPRQHFLSVKSLLLCLFFKIKTYKSGISNFNAPLKCVVPGMCFIALEKDPSFFIRRKHTGTDLELYVTMVSL